MTMQHDLCQNYTSRKPELLVTLGSLGQPFPEIFFLGGGLSEWKRMTSCVLSRPPVGNFTPSCQVEELNFIIREDPIFGLSGFLSCSSHNQLQSVCALGPCVYVSCWCKPPTLTVMSQCSASLSSHSSAAPSSSLTKKTQSKVKKGKKSWTSAKCKADGAPARVRELKAHIHMQEERPRMPKSFDVQLIGARIAQTLRCSMRNDK